MTEARYEAESEAPYMGPDFVAECAFSAVVESCIYDASEAAAEVASRAGDSHPADAEGFRILANDAAWVAHAVAASRAWGHIGDNPQATLAASRAYSRAASLLGTDDESERE